MKIYKGYTIEFVDGLLDSLYLIYDLDGFYKGQAISVKEAKKYINDYLL
jgi:hypothetical protein